MASETPLLTEHFNKNNLHNNFIRKTGPGKVSMNYIVRGRRSKHVEMLQLLAV